jgi:hypothetical protein
MYCRPTNTRENNQQQNNATGLQKAYPHGRARFVVRVCAARPGGFLFHQPVVERSPGASACTLVSYR